tara:strand:- start:733 stop:1263 length:531 start_codon:yes stop_codon:yes gene_type:complete
MALISNGTSIVSGGGLASGIGGKVIQVQYAQFNGAYSFDGDWHNTALSDSITPTSSSNKIIIQMFLGRVAHHGNNSMMFRLRRGTTLINVGTQIDSRQRVTGALMRVTDDTNHTQGMLGMTFIDAPSTTSATTYTLQARKEGGGSWYLNRSQNFQNTSNEYGGVGSSFMYLMEVAI